MSYDGVGSGLFTSNYSTVILTELSTYTEPLEDDYKLNRDFYSSGSGRPNEVMMALYGQSPDNPCVARRVMERLETYNIVRFIAVNSAPANIFMIMHTHPVSREALLSDDDMDGIRSLLEEIHSYYSEMTGEYEYVIAHLAAGVSAYIGDWGSTPTYFMTLYNIMMFIRKGNENVINNIMGSVRTANEIISSRVSGVKKPPREMSLDYSEAIMKANDELGNHRDRDAYVKIGLMLNPASYGMLYAAAKVTEGGLLPPRCPPSRVKFSATNMSFPAGYVAKYYDAVNSDILVHEHEFNLAVMSKAFENVANRNYLVVVSGNVIPIRNV